MVDAGPVNLLEDDLVGVAEDGQALGRDLAEKADGQAGAGEGMLEDEVAIGAELEPEGADLVLEKLLERLDQGELEVLGKAADVVVGLDDVRGPLDRVALDDVGIDRPLGQERDPAELGSPRVRRCG